MRVSTIHFHTATNTLTLDDGTEVELDYEPVGYADPLMTEINDHIVVSYLVYDDSGMAENPFTASGEFGWDQVGRSCFYSSSAAYSNALESIEEEWIEMRTAELLESGEILSHWDFDEVPPEFDDDTVFRVFSQTPAEYRYAFNSNFDTSQPWIRMVEANDLQSVTHVLTIPVETMPNMAKSGVDAFVKSMLGEYTDMIRGEVYGCVTHVYDSHGTMSADDAHNEAVWGYVGDKWAKDSLADQHISMVSYLKNNDEED